MNWGESPVSADLASLPAALPFAFFCFAKFDSLSLLLGFTGLWPALAFRIWVSVNGIWGQLFLKMFSCPQSCPQDPVGCQATRGDTVGK
jgi:hypothetical protein